LPYTELLIFIAIPPLPADLVGRLLPVGLAEHFAGSPEIGKHRPKQPGGVRRHGILLWGNIVSRSIHSSTRPIDSVRDPLTFHFGALFFGLRGNPTFWFDAKTRKTGVVTIVGFVVFAFVHEARAHPPLGRADASEVRRLLSFTGFLNIRGFVGGSSKFVAKPAHGVIATPRDTGVGPFSNVPT